MKPTVTIQEANLSALSGWLPILGIGLVAVLGLKALSK